jgi:hypothetical protein
LLFVELSGQYIPHFGLFAGSNAVPNNDLNDELHGGEKKLLVV